MQPPSTPSSAPHVGTGELIELDRTYGAHNYAPLPVVLASGRGSWVTDVEGRSYLDMLSAYSAMSFGHLHPELVTCAREQLERLTLTSRAFHNDQLPHFCHELAELAGQDMVLPMNTGAEAVETALKAARRWGYEVKGVPENAARVVVFDNNFHGRTITAVSMSSSPSAHRHYGPFTPGFDRVPYGDIDAVRGVLRDETVAVLVEPIQGEGGVVVPPEGFLTQLRELCDRSHALLLCDEIQTGLARTGLLFESRREEVEADLLILGKALGGGIVPLSAVVGKREVLEVFTPGTHGSTFGGNPLACALGRKVVRLLADGTMARRAAELGDRLRGALAALTGGCVREVRGRGLLLGIELDEAAGPAKKVAEALLVHGVLTSATKGSVLRLAPPLVASEDDIDYGAAVVSKLLQEWKP